MTNLFSFSHHEEQRSRQARHLRPGRRANRDGQRTSSKLQQAQRIPSEINMAPPPSPLLTRVRLSAFSPDVLLLPLRYTSTNEQPIERIERRRTCRVRFWHSKFDLRAAHEKTEGETLLCAIHYLTTSCHEYNDSLTVFRFRSHSSRSQAEIR